MFSLIGVLITHNSPLLDYYNTYKIKKIHEKKFE